MNTIGKNIKLTRQNKKMSQKELADKLNISQAAISQFEKNSTTPKLDTIKKIANALEVPYFELIDLKLNDGSILDIPESFGEESNVIADEFSVFLDNLIKHRKIDNILKKIKMTGINYRFDVDKNSHEIELIFNDGTSKRIDDKTLLLLDKDSNDYLKFKLTEYNKTPNSSE